MTYAVKERVMIAEMTIAEGRIRSIELNPAESSEPYWLDCDDQDSPLVMTFTDPVTGYYIRLFDLRKAVQALFDIYANLRYDLARELFPGQEIDEAEIDRVVDLLNSENEEGDLLELTRSARDQFRISFMHESPCLASCRIKNNVQYLVLNDLGAADMIDNGPDSNWILSNSDVMDRELWRVVVGTGKRAAMHFATKICLAEPRPAKPVETE